VQKTDTIDTPLWKNIREEKNERLELILENFTENKRKEQLRTMERKIRKKKT
jgi:hypothetical protein